MREPQCCRACLATDVRMCPLERYGLGRSYAALVGHAFDEDDGLSDAVCYECAHRLDTFRRFRKRGRRAHAALQGLLEELGEITAPSVRKIDRTQIGLAPSLFCYNLKPIIIETTINTPSHIILKLEEPETKYFEVAIDTGSEENRPNIVEDEFKGKPERCSDKLDYYVSFIPGAGQSEAKISATPKKVETKHKKTVTKLDETKRAAKVKLENAAINRTQKKEKVVPKRKRVMKNADAEEPTAEEGAKKVKKVRKVKCEGDEVVPRKKKTSKAIDVTKDIANAGGVKTKRSRTRLGNRPRVQYSAEYYNSFATITVMTDEEQVECFSQRQNSERYKNAQYKCTDCYLGFITRACYEDHRKRHDDPSQGPEVCKICKVRLKSTALLKKHITTNHRTKFVCKKCPYTCTFGPQARDHESTHTEKLYPCTVCGSVFKMLSTYRVHQNRMHPPLLACPMCGLTYPGQGAMNKHRANMHSKVDTADCKVLCDCGTRFVSEEARDVHRSSHPQHADLHGNTSAICCEYCEEKFPDLEVTLKHRMTHMHVTFSAKHRACETCGLVVSNRGYNKHLHHAHPEKMPTNYPTHIPGCGIMCELCGKVHKRSSSYRHHMVRHHHGESPYKCEICNKSYADPFILNEHRRIHTKEKPYQCTICNKRFTHKSNFARHALVHKDGTLYSCDICGKDFKYKYAVKYHIQYVHLKKPWPKRDRTKRYKKAVESDRQIVIHGMKSTHV